VAEHHVVDAVERLSSRLVTDLPFIERFTSWLRERNLPVTAQRLAVADLLFASDHPRSAEEIADGLGARGIRVGTATVYRTLDVLVESGLVIERDLGEGFLRFEAASDESMHDHLRCTSCGRLELFRDDGVELLAERVAAQHGMDRERQRLVIHGICADCRAGRSGPNP
jgi:Fur family ferric uptake transcriptional regulator